MGALLTAQELELIAKLPDDVARGLLWHADWMDKALDHQLAPPGDWWTIWLLLAGRGAGKTRTSAETIGWWAWSQPGTRWLVSAPTYGDLIGTCFEGESGLLSVIPHELIELTSSGALYNKTDVELRLKNGSLIKGISAENPERFRGPQFHGGWLDELAAWQRADEAFDMLMFGMRLGDRPRLIISTTPKPKPIIARLLKREAKDVTVSRASTYANLANLAPTFREQILQYEGTALGRQEIHAEVLDPEDQGIVKRSWLQLWPADKPLPAFDLIVLSLDTAFTEATRNARTGDADYTGCTVWGLFREERQDGILLLDSWQERLGMPDLVERAKREMAVQYGDRDKPLITPIYGAPLLGNSGRKPDLCVIEDKGSGISLRQMLAREGLQTVAYNPGRASKLERLHMVSHLFANGLVWLVESDKRPGQPRSWAEPLIEQLCSFSGEKSIPHDDLVDSATQALRVIVDKMGVSVANPREIDEYWRPQRRGNPYAA